MAYIFERKMARLQNDGQWHLYSGQNREIVHNSGAIVDNFKDGLDHNSDSRPVMTNLVGVENGKNA